MLFWQLILYEWVCVWDLICLLLLDSTPSNDAESWSVHVVFLNANFVMMYWCFRLLLSFQFCNGFCLPCAQRLFDNWRIPRNGRCRPTLHGRTGRFLVHCRIHFSVTINQWKTNLCYWAYASFAFKWQVVVFRLPFSISRVPGAVKVSQTTFLCHW